MRLGLALLVASAAGCASGSSIRVPPDSPFASRSLSNYDAALRHYMVAGDSAALDRIQRSGPKDSLVRLLNRGLYLHRLGRYAESNAALQAAESLAEERYTKSISQRVAAFMVSDVVIDYTPSALERAMIHYYGMINYLALDDLEEALVEARRANEYLDRYNRDNEGRRSYSNDALVQYLAGLLHWTGGDDNDALVSLRRADASFDSYRTRYRVTAPAGFGQDLERLALRVGVPEVAEAAIAKYGLDDNAPLRAPAGELLVIVENGFIAHRAEEKVYIPITRTERRAIGSGAPDSILMATADILIRTLLFMNQASKEARSYLREYEGLVVLGSTVLDADLFSFAWTAYELEAHAVTDVTVELNDGEEQLPATVVSDLSAIAARDYEEQKPKFMLRMLARGLFKQVVALKTEAAVRDRGGAVAGFLTRLGTQAAATLTERADTRSWSLLPAELRVARFSLTPGTHHVVLRVRDRTGTPRVIDLGLVDIRQNRLAVRTAFVTGGSSGDQTRFLAAKAQVDYVMPVVRPGR